MRAAATSTSSVANSRPELRASGTRPVAPRLAVLLPCLNEESAIARVVREFASALPGAVVFVYDNGSTDATAEQAQAAGAIVRHEGRLGKGSVVRRMFADVDADVYVIVDGDGTYDASRAPAMVALLLDSRLDMVVATRDGDEDADTAERRGHQIGNRAFNRFVGLIFGREFSDIFSGYRVLSSRFVKTFPSESRGFEIETELSIHALELRLPFAEIPARYRPRGQDTEESKLRTVRDGLRISGTVLRLFRQIRPLAFFGLLAGILTIAAWSLGYVVVSEFVHTGQILHIPSAILATGLQLLAALCLLAGLILDSVSKGRRELKRLFYLDRPWLDCGSLPGDQNSERR